MNYLTVPQHENTELMHTTYSELWSLSQENGSHHTPPTPSVRKEEHTSVLTKMCSVSKLCLYTHTVETAFKPIGRKPQLLIMIIIHTAEYAVSGRKPCTSHHLCMQASLSEDWTFSVRPIVREGTSSLERITTFQKSPVMGWVWIRSPDELTPQTGTWGIRMSHQWFSTSWPKIMQSVSKDSAKCVTV